MAIKKYIASQDNVITDAFKANLTTRGTAGNMGASDILEVFSIHAQANTSSLERTRTLVQFPVHKILEDRNSGNIPASGSVNFFINLYNAPHSQTVPSAFDLAVAPVLASWEEGHGLDMEEYTNEEACNWISSSLGTKWASEGGDYHTSLSASQEEYTYRQHFESGLEDLSIDVTPLVEQWLSTEAGSTPTNANCKLVFSDQPASGSYIEITNAFGTTKRFVFNSGGSSNSNAELVDQTVATGSEGANYVTVTIAHNLGTTIENLQQAITGSESVEPGEYGFLSSSLQGFETSRKPTSIALTASYAGFPGNKKIDLVGTTNATIQSGDGVTNSEFTGGSGMYNYGVGVFLSGSYEDGSRSRSYYTKKFFARGSQHFFRKPVIEARWDSTLKDDRGNLTTASPFLTDTQNTQKIYYKNYVNGTLSDLHATPKFSLTTDKDLAQKVTLPTTSSLNSISDAVSGDYTKNAYAEFKINGVGSPYANSTGNTWITVEHTDPVSSTIYRYVLVGNIGTRISTANSAANIAYPNIWSVTVRGQSNSANTAQNRALVASYLPENFNNLRSGSVDFSNFFFAEATGEKIRIYTKISGDAGANASSITLHHFSGSNRQTAFESFNAATNAKDTDSAITTEDEFDQFVMEHWYTQADGGRASSGWGGPSSPKNMWGNAGFGAPFNRDTPPKFISEKRVFSGNQTVSPQDIETTKVATGTYKAEFKIPDNLSSTELYEKWWLDTDVKGNALEENAGIVNGKGGSKHVSFSKYEDTTYPGNDAEYVVSITNLKPSYSTKETVRFNVFTREKNINQNVYTKATNTVSTSYLTNAFYQIKRIADNFVVIPYSTGSINFSGLDYDSTGNSFDLDLSLLEPNYSYEVSFLCKKDVNYIELQDKFKFRVDP